MQMFLIRTEVHEIPVIKLEVQNKGGCKAWLEENPRCLEEKSVHIRESNENNIPCFLGYVCQLVIDIVRVKMAKKCERDKRAIG